jgi:hypothetical protein
VLLSGDISAGDQPRTQGQLGRKQNQMVRDIRKQEINTSMKSPEKIVLHSIIPKSSSTNKWETSKQHKSISQVL